MSGQKGRPTYLILNGRKISYADIKSGGYATATTEFERSTLEFSRSWLSGEQSFKLKTSGSTGKPKTITIPRESMETSAKWTGKALGLSPRDRALLCLPTSFVAGKMMLVRGFELGLMITASEPDSNPSVNFSRPRDFAFTAMVPMQLQEVLQGSSKPCPLNGMKAILIGGAPISSQLEESSQDVDSPIYATYGMTETVSHVALRRVNGADRSKWYEALDGVSFGQDDRHCLSVHAPQLIASPLQTNDVVELQGAGKFRWLGRVDNVVNSAGIKIQPELLEKEISSLLPDQLQSRRFILVGLKDLKLGERLVMVMEGPEFRKEARFKLLETIKSKLDAHHSPKEILSVPHFLETSNGKINRMATLAYHSIE